MGSLFDPTWLSALAADFWQHSVVKAWLAFLLIGLAVEVALKAEKGQPLRAILFNVRYGALYLAIIFILSPTINVATGQIAAKLGAGWIDIDFFSRTQPLGQIAAGIGLLIVTDFFYYWWHRLQHTLPLLWDQHLLHHSDESLNVSTSMRHHWSEFIFQAFLVTLPMNIIFVMTPVNMWIVSTVISAWSWFIHMNIRLHLGPLSCLIAGPQVHRIHHSPLSQHLDRNFAAYFPVWDVLFGTYYGPAKDEYPPTGVPGVRIATATEAAVYPFKRWIQRLAAIGAAKLDKAAD